MATDAARVYTDRELEKLEKKLERAYARAKTEVEAEWREYMTKHGAKAEKLYDALKNAEKGSNRRLIAEAKQKYQREMKRLTGANRRYKRMVDNLSTKLANIDKLAYDMANNILPDIYAVNYNDIKIPMGYVFGLLDSTTIKNLAMGKLDLLADARWIRERLNSEILKGILQGESIPKIAKRLEPMVDGNLAAAKRNARTAVTFAENRGRLDSMKAAADIGLVYEKEWISTHDSRTRESHLHIDGERATLYEPFSNGLMCPADPNGDPAEVYNCRCTMNRILVGIKRADGRFERI